PANIDLEVLKPSVKPLRHSPVFRKYVHASTPYCNLREKACGICRLAAASIISSNISLMSFLTQLVFVMLVFHKPSAELMRARLQFATPRHRRTARTREAAQLLSIVQQLAVLDTQLVGPAG